jgi:uncharacterized protein
VWLWSNIYKINHTKNIMANDNNDNTDKRGFASMDAEKQREIASKGGKAAHEKGTAHEFSSEEAREAGRKGGQARGNNNQDNE